MPEVDSGFWSDLEAQGFSKNAVDAAKADVEAKRNYVRTFENTDAGAQVLAELRRLFLDRDVQPSESDAALRHMEGQRSVVRHILRQIEAGKR